MDANELIKSMFGDIAAAERKKKNERMERAESLFRNHASILLTPLIYWGPTRYEFFFAARDNPSLEASFRLPGAVENPDRRRNLICVSDPNANYALAVSYASMLTFLGLDVYMFSAQNRKEFEDQQSEPEVRIELFDPIKPPDLIFVLSSAHYKALFGIEP